MYTKHNWENDKYFNFGYVKYLPKNYDESKKYHHEFSSKTNDDSAR